MSEDVTGELIGCVSEPHEIIVATMGKNEPPTEGEWKRAMADRRVMEEAYRRYIPDMSSDTVHLAHKLRGERFIAVPEGAHSVAFLWRIAAPSEVAN